MGSQRVDICFLEDDENDVFIIQRALAMAKLPVAATFVRKFEQLQQVLAIRLQNSRLPEVIVTDLKLTGEDGFGVLSWLKSHPELRHIPVIVLTSSNVEKDRLRCDVLGASAFLTKSCSIRSLSGAFQTTLQPFLHPLAVG